MSKKKKTIIVLIIIACILAVLFGLYYQNLLKIETGNDYASVKELTFFVNKPESCVWVRGLGQTFLDLRSLIKCETIVILLKYNKEEDIKFFKPAEFSRKWFEEDYDENKKEYGRLLDSISPNLLEKEWQHVNMEGRSMGFGTEYLYDVYICYNEVLVIATDASW